MVADEGVALAVGNSFDVSSQYHVMRRGLLPVYTVLAVGGLAVEFLVWVYANQYLAGSTRPYAVGLLLLVAGLFSGTGGFVKWIERGYAIRSLRVDESGVHVIRIRGPSTELAWTDPSFDLWFGQRTPSLGTRPSSPSEYLTVRGLRLPVYFEVPVGVLDATLREAGARAFPVESHAEEHRGKYGVHYWWVTTVRAPPKLAVGSTRTGRGGSVSSEGRPVSTLT